MAGKEEVITQKDEKRCESTSVGLQSGLSSRVVKVFVVAWDHKITDDWCVVNVTLPTSKKMWSMMG